MFPQIVYEEGGLFFQQNVVMAGTGKHSQRSVRTTATFDTSRSYNFIGMREMALFLAWPREMRRLTHPLLFGFAGLVAHDAADRCAADSSSGTAARENVTRDAPDGGADRGVILLRRHAAATAKR